MSSLGTINWTNYELDPIPQAADEQQTPEELLQIVQQSLETRARHALDPDDAISRYRRSVIMGDPGARKSTLLKYFLFQTLEGQLPGLPTLPIHNS
jgi:predicted NACHT family NTPase